MDLNQSQRALVRKNSNDHYYIINRDVRVQAPSCCFDKCGLNLLFVYETDQHKNGIISTSDEVRVNQTLSYFAGKRLNLCSPSEQKFDIMYQKALKMPTF